MQTRNLRFNRARRTAKKSCTTTRTLKLSLALSNQQQQGSKMQGKANLTLHELINVALKAKEAGIKLSAYVGSVGVTDDDILSYTNELMYIDLKLHFMAEHCKNLVANIAAPNPTNEAAVELRSQLFAEVAKVSYETKRMQQAVNDLLKCARRAQRGKRRS